MFGSFLPSAWSLTKLTGVEGAYGLQDLRIKKPNPLRSSNPNGMYRKHTPGENLGSGHSYIAKNRTFLLCVDKVYSYPMCGPYPRSSLQLRVLRLGLLQDGDVGVGVSLA